MYVAVTVPYIPGSLLFKFAIDIKSRLSVTAMLSFVFVAFEYTGIR